MRLPRVVLHRLQSLLHRGRVEESLSRELDIHIQALTRELTAQGMSPSEARLEARRQFGSVAFTEEQCRDARRVRFLEDLFRDIAYSLRTMRKSPGFALTAILSIALGIGANTVVFSVLNALLLRPAPIREPDRVFSLDRNGRPASSYPAYLDIRDRSTVFESLFVSRVTQMALGEPAGRTRRVWGYLVTGNYFDSLGIQPALGRFFTPAEDRHRNASPYAVLSYDTWQTRFAADPAIAGKDIRLNGHPYRVLGVAPRGFHGTEVFFWPEVWIPLSQQQQIEGNSWLDCRGCGNAWIAGRLKPGVTVQQAEANLRSVAAQLGREHRVHEGMALTLSPTGLVGSLGRSATKAFTGGVMLLAFLVLLAACANLALLQTARGVDRDRELGIRLSIGASRGRIVRQLITESIVVSILGAAAGVALALLLLQLLSQWRAPLDFPIAFDVSADWRVFAFSFAITLFTGILLGLGLARRAWKTDPAAAIKGAAPFITGTRFTLRDLLLPVQIALCCFLVASSLVSVQGLLTSANSPLGYRPDGVAVTSYDLTFTGYDATRGREFHLRMIGEVSRLPGVESAAWSNSVPLSIDSSTTTVYPENTTEFIPRNGHSPQYYSVSPGYFETIGTKILAGRTFTLQDNANAPRVAIVNLTFARRVIGTPDAVGRRFRQGRDSLFEIVGVVEDGKYQSLTEEPRPALFYSMLQSYNSTSVLLARTRRPEAEVANEMRQIIASHEPDLAVYGTGSLRQMLGFVYLPMHAAAIALGAFGLLALMLAVTGIHGLSAYTVARKSREIGIRMAIGARPRQVLAFVFGRLGRLVAAGAVLGIILSVAAAGVLASIVYQATPRDPRIIALTSAAIVLISLAAALGPARRSIRIDPLRSLRQD